MSPLFAAAPIALIAGELVNRHPPECLSQACKDEDDIRVHLTSSAEQDAYLSQLDGLDAIKAIVPLGLDGVLSDDEKQLYQMLSESKTSGSLDELDGGVRPLPADLTTTSREDALVSEREPEDLQGGTSDAAAESSDVLDFVKSPPLLVVTLSCVAALLALLCVSVVLYTAHYIRTRALASDLARKILSQQARHALGPGDGPRIAEKGTLPEKALLMLDVERADTASESPDTVHDSEEKPEILFSMSDEEDLDEKFEDAPDNSLLFLGADMPAAETKPELPRILIEEHGDPASLPLTPYSTPPPGPPLSLPSPSPIRRSLEMRELPRPSSPAWSLRASDSPSLTLSALSSGRESPAASPRIPGALILDAETTLHASDATSTVDRADGRRAYRAPIPELDIAFALQLRPGLGIGADPAWLVRFLMAMFGWMTVILGGSNARTRR